MKVLQKNVWTIFLLLTLLLSGCVSEKSHQSEKHKTKDITVQPKEISDPSGDLLNNMMDWAEKGTVKGSSFNALDSTMKQVKIDWGEPDKVEHAGYGFYADFNEKKIALGYNKFGDIFDVRSYDDNLKKVTDNMVVAALGQPADIRDNTVENIYVYNPNPEIQLKIIIPKSTNAIDHISVFNPMKANDYTLEIRGKSTKLSDQTLASMLKWRSQIALFSKKQEHVYINGPDKKKVALTFDDGPDDVITPAVIEILSNYHVKGNFFFLGSEVKKHPDVVKNAYDRGNLVLSHSYNHVELPKLSKEAVRKEIADSGQAIKSVIGKEPAILRTPYGDTDEQVAETAKEEGFSIVLWSIDTLDWAHDEPNQIINNVLDNIRNGDIILMHSDLDQVETKIALPQIIEELQKRNFEIVDLEELLDITAYQ